MIIYCSLEQQLYRYTCEHAVEKILGRQSEQHHLPQSKQLNHFTLFFLSAFRSAVHS